MKRLVVLLLLSACPPPTRFLCDPATGADCLPDGGSTGGGNAGGGVVGGGSAVGCDACSAQGLGQAACVQGRCVITCQAGTLPTGAGCELPVAVAVSEVSVCVRTAQGNVGCAGLSALGHVPSGRQPFGLALTPLPQPASMLVAGRGSVCAATTGRQVFCWGSNSRGELGNGALSTSELVPTKVAADDLVSVAQGGLQGCAVRSDGGVLCWGSNPPGLGFAPGGMMVTVPTEVVGVTQPLMHVRARDLSVVGLTADGQVLGWGPPTLLQNDVAAPSQSGARRLVLPFRARTLDIGSAVRFVVDVDGGLWAWGTRPLGIGVGSPLVFNADAGPSGFSSEPLRTNAPADVREVCQGLAHACVLTGSRAVWCWGDNTFGQLGDGTFVARDTPQPIAALEATSLSCSDDLTCATTASGVVCWGRNNTRLGTELPAQTPIPRLVAPALP